MKNWNILNLCSILYLIFNRKGICCLIYGLYVSFYCWYKFFFNIFYGSIWFWFIYCSSLWRIDDFFSNNILNFGLYLWNHFSLINILFLSLNYWDIFPIYDNLISIGLLILFCLIWILVFSLNFIYILISCYILFRILYTM